MFDVFRTCVVPVLATGFMMSLLAGCRSAAPTVQALDDDGTKWSMQNGSARVVVDGPRGRITEYGLLDNGEFRNVFWLNPEADQAKYNLGGWTNWGGDKLWPWPQNGAWGWPPPEPKDGYQVQRDGDKLVMTATMPRQNVRATREIELADDNSSMVVTSRFDPIKTAFGAPVGVWSITQTVHPKRIYVRIPNVGDRNRYLTRTPAKDDRFQTRLVGNAVVELTPDWDRGGKTFSDGDVIAAVFDDFVLLQRLVPVHTYGVWAPDERCQIYVHPKDQGNVPQGYSYVELEWAAPTVPTLHIAQTPLRVVYKLVRIKPETSQQDIIKMVDQLP